MERKTWCLVLNEQSARSWNSLIEMPFSEESGMDAPPLTLLSGEPVMGLTTSAKITGRFGKGPSLQIKVEKRLKPSTRLTKPSPFSRPQFPHLSLVILLRLC